MTEEKRITLVPIVAEAVARTAASIEKPTWRRAGVEMEIDKARHRLEQALADLRMSPKINLYNPATWPAVHLDAVFEVVDVVWRANNCNSLVAYRHLGIDRRLFLSWLDHPKFAEWSTSLVDVERLSRVTKQLAQQKIAEVLSQETDSFRVLQMQTTLSKFVVKHDLALVSEARKLEELRAEPKVAPKTRGLPPRVKPPPPPAIALPAPEDVVDD